MPIFDEPLSAPARPEFPKVPEVDVPEGSILGAAFRTENIAVNSFNQDFGPNRPDPSFDPWAEIEGTEYENHFEDFAATRNAADAKRLKTQIDQENQDRQVLDNAGGRGVAAQMFAGFVDVPSLVPGAQAVRGASLGYNVTRNASRTARAALAEAVVVEGALQQMQATRTTEESAVAIGGSVILGGILGAGVGAALRRTPEGEEVFKNAARALDGKPAVSRIGLDDDLEADQQFLEGLSADVTAQPTRDDFVNPSRVAQTAINLAPRGTTFGLSGIRAESAVTQNVFANLIDTPFALKGTDRLDLEPAVEVAQAVELDKARISIGRGFQEEYSGYLKQEGRSRIAAEFNVTGEALTKAQFSERVAKALRREDFDENPFVRNAAERMRREVIEPLKEKAVKNGLLPEDVKVETAASYFTRMWDAEEITRRSTEFKQRLTDHFEAGLRASREAETSKFAKAEIDAEAARRDADISRERDLQAIADTGRTEAVEVSQEQIDQIVSALKGAPKKPVSLLQYLSKMGIQDELGELTQLGVGDWHKGKPGTRRIIKQDGADLDEAARVAYEAGYIDAYDPRVLLDAIDDELRLGPVYSRADAEQVAKVQDYLDIEEYAASLGISRGGSYSVDTISKAKGSADAATKAINAIYRLRTQAKDIKSREFDLDDVELRGYAEEAASDVYNTLTAPGRIPDNLNLTVKARGPLKERTLNVRDEDFEDFLNNDSEYVLNRYARVMTADIALKERFGSADLSQQIADVANDYQKLIDAAPEGKKRTELARERDRQLDRLDAVRDMLRGTYQVGVKNGMPYRVIQSALTYNYVRALGSLVLSALPDVFRLAMVNGVRNTWDGALRPLITNAKASAVSRAQARDLAGVAEVELNNRLMAIADIADPIGRQTPVENALNTMGAVASKFSGATYWNDFLKGMAMQVTTTRLRKLDLEGKNDTAFRQRLKLNKRDAQSIKSAMEKYGIDAEGAFDPRVEKWPERVRDIYARVLRADADTAIVTPGIGDKVPGAEHHYWLKPALQFKSFAVAAHSRVMVAGLQEDQTRFLASAASMAAMGMFVYYLKSLSSGRETSDNPGTWLAEGIDRSGVFPLYMEANNWVESMGAPGVYNILSMGEDEASRYAVRSTTGRVMGPTAGLINDTAVTLRAALSQINPAASEDAKDITSGDIGSMRRLIPFGRHPGVKEMLDLWAIPNVKEMVN